MNSFRTPGTARSLLLLLTLALLVHFINSAGLLRPAKDRFDFSSAICATAPASAGVTAVSGDSGDSVPAGQHEGGSCCDLCCGAAVPVADSTAAAGGPVAAGNLHPVGRASAILPAADWAPQSARAPPSRS